MILLCQKVRKYSKTNRYMSKAKTRGTLPKRASLATFGTIQVISGTDENIINQKKILVSINDDSKKGRKKALFSRISTN